MSTYSYSAGWREILVEDASDGVFAKITDQRGGGYESITLPEGERQTAAQTLAGSGYRVVPVGEYSGEDLDAARAEIDRLNQAAQPDRPEPVDPASVRVGHYVHVESVDRYVNIGPEWAVQGAIGQDHGSFVSIRADDGWITLSRGMGVWTVLHRAEPEPDEAAVEALRQVMRDTFRVGSSPGVELDEEWIERHALALVKHNVRVVSE